MKIRTLSALFTSATVCLTSSLFAEKMDVQVVEDNGNRIVLSYEFPEYHMDDVNIKGDVWQQPVLRGENHTLIEGYPALPDVSRAVVIPDTGEMSLRILEASCHDVEGVKIAPSKGNVSRAINIDALPYTFGKVYKQNAFWPENIATLRDPHIIRDIRGAVVDVYPFQYNGANQTLRVLDTLKVELTKTNEGGKNTVTRVDKHSIGPAYSILMDRHFLNYDLANRYDPLSDDGDILVICYDDYLPNIQPYADHKTSTGFNVNVVGVSTIGNNDTAIKAYISNMYESSDLGFVLLVGDAFHVDTGTHPFESGANDPQYGQISGSDHYPEVIVGRFSAESGADVDTQVQRTIEFEENQETQEEWYKNGTGIASAEGAGSGDDGEGDWEHANVIREKLLDHGYGVVDQIYDNNGGSSSMVTNAVNEGRGLINYTGHGSTTAWSTTGFNNSNVNGLSNTGKLPWIVSVACVNGQYNGPTCFAEAWLRATSGGQPSGAVLAYMSSVNQSWSPPMSAQDEVVDLFLAEGYRCCGVLAMAGSCLMIDEYGSAGEDMMDTWHIFGDPTLCVVGTTAPPTGLKVSGTDLHAEGPLGGPFVPYETTYTLKNHDEDDMYWHVTNSVPWATVEPMEGTIGGGQSVEVRVELNNSASNLGNGLHEGMLEFINETTHDGDTSKGLSVNVGVPVPAYSYTLDSDPNWDMTGEWSFGTPTGQGGGSFGNADPSSAATGQYVCGINLNGDYLDEVGSQMTLTTHAIDCSMLMDTELKFQRWLNTDYQPYVTAYVQVSNNGSTWETLWDNGVGEIADSSWSEQSFDISDFADEQPMVYVRWTHQVTQDFSYAYSGWNIDDVEIWGVNLDDTGDCYGDVNSDGIIGVSDILSVFDNWGACSGCDSDVTGDGNVNVSDILAIIGAWGVCE